MSTTCTIRRNRLRAALAERDERAYKLAAALNLSPTALSAMCNGHRPAPLELVERIERHLGLEVGSLVDVEAGS